ncbi:hypothetical protein [Vibrio sp. HN007]|uniref:hypothetical protein n=1 Tax=Vibrio iocasae TaxID=3098914 RepID=UPI0035D51F88
MADVSTNELESTSEWSLDALARWTGQTVHHVIDVYGDVEKVKAENQPKTVTNTANPAKTVTEAVQTPQTVPAQDKTKLYAGAGAALIIFVLVLVFALRGKK